MEVLKSSLPKIFRIQILKMWRWVSICLLTFSFGASESLESTQTSILSIQRFDPPNPFVLPKDGAYYLEQYAPMLRSYVLQVRKQSLEKNYAFYSSRPIVEYSAYRDLSADDREALRGGIVLVGAHIAEFIKYSHLGGVGIGAKLKPSDEKTFYMSFDGRYLSDLEAFGIGKEIFAYCVLPRFDKCIMLGIGEEW